MGCDQGPGRIDNHLVRRYNCCEFESATGELALTEKSTCRTVFSEPGKVEAGQAPAAENIAPEP